ncbi:MAG: hypothetical protein J5I93_01110 [Pirellulaceae bacterium]|nr:hypothetical protein [Pirellulaceae bacterium]
MNRLAGHLVAILAIFLGRVPCLAAQSESAAERFAAALLRAEQVTDSRLAQLRDRGTRQIVLELRATDPAARRGESAAAERVQQAGLPLYYWIEVARCELLADAHPRWMASLQGHSEWRRLWPDAPVPGPDQVVKNYPWVPILYRESFDAQLERVAGLLSARPKAAGVFLNDLQGAPSACGCGNSLCRWTADYGPIRTATPLGDDAAAQFVAAVSRRVPPGCEVIPVWTTECEEADGAADGPCAGVGCFRGICWKAYTSQLAPLARQCPTLAVLAPYRAFERDLPRYGEPAGWVRHAVRSFATMPPRHGGEAVEAGRLVVVLQGWDATEAQVAAQIRMAGLAGARGYVMSYVPLDQRWEPRLVRWR